MNLPRGINGTTSLLPVIVTALAAFAGCSDQTRQPMEASEAPRQLEAAFDGETGVRIEVNGAVLSDPALAERLRVDVVIDSPTFDGDPDNKTIEIGPTHTAATIVRACTACEINVVYHDLLGSAPGPLDSWEGTLADGDYTVKLIRDGTTTVASVPIAVNHTNGGGGNGSFLDEASDQKITFFLNGSLNSIAAPDVDPAHTRASTHLTASIVQPAGADTTILVGQSLTVQGSASNGVGGTKRFAWDWDASGTSTETFDTEFNTSTTASHTWNTVGDYEIRLLARDGNDDFMTPPRGGHYAISTTKTVHVDTLDLDDAEGIGHTLPGTITVGEWVATSVTMKNTGTNTWTTSDYELGQANSPLLWTPLQVSLSSPVASLETRTVNFNMTTFEPEFAGTTQDNFWRMRHNTTFFGDVVGRQTTVKSGETASLWNRLLARLGPATAWARGVATTLGVAQDEVVQVIRKEEYPLDVRALETEGRAVIRYTGSLAEPWPVDFAFHLEFDPKVFRLGALVQGVKAAGYTLETEVEGGEVTIRARRGPGAALQPGEGKILEIPLVLQPGVEVPETLPLIELVTTK